MVNLGCKFLFFCQDKIKFRKKKLFFLTNLKFGNHDQPRIGDKFGETHVNGLNTLILLLPGTPVTYYGEEIGLLGRSVSFDDTQDIFCKRFGPERYKLFSRDPQRGPMLWSGAKNAGFSNSNKTWLPVHKDFKTLNIEHQLKSDNATHPLQIYKKLVKFRSEESAFIRGSFNHGYTTSNIYSFTRQFNKKGFLVVINVGKEDEEIENAFNCFNLTSEMKPQVVFHTLNEPNYFSKMFHVNNDEKQNKILLTSGNAFVVSFVKV